MNQSEIQQQLADQRRGRYVRVSDVDRRQLIDAYKKGEDFIALARKLNIKRSTARSILRTFIDEGRVSAKQRAGTRLRFITEEEAEMIREMKRRHPLITIGQIQMRLQRTSTRVLSKASISRILTNSIRLGKRAKRSGEDGDDGQDEMTETMGNGQDELMQLSSDEGTGEGIYIDDEIDEEEEDDDDDEETRITETNAPLQNLDDFQRFMLRKTSINGDESIGNEGAAWSTKEQYDDNGYAGYDSENEDELSEIDENETKSLVDPTLNMSLLPIPINEKPAISIENDNWGVKSEPVCVFVNRNFDSSDSEQPATIDEETTKRMLNTQSTANRRIKTCPICGETNFSRLSHHLTVAHNLNREESLTLLAYSDRNNNHSSIPIVSSSSPKNLDKSPQQTPITINTNNQQITPAGLSPNGNDLENPDHPTIIKTSSSVEDQQSANSLSADGKKRLLCPRCNTWVLNLTDHLIKKHHLVSKQERLPFLRLARNRSLMINVDKPSTNSFLINSNEQHIIPTAVNKKYQNIIKKYRKKFVNTYPSSSSIHETPALPPPATNSNQNLLTTNNNNNSLKQNSISKNTNTNKDISVHHKFEQRLSVFRQQFAVTVAMQNSLMQQMELLQRSFVCIEEEWNDMKKEIVESIS
ncbi:unnamed protein product [Adineta steineri]|uniref:Uncharacterized protein n=1 Tax=Adineta steineri TaxID=433720 RepID=A0A819U416_9BILA|nr:unnamed protein product [Adineta steineri]